MNDLDVLRQAILNEAEGAAFYAMAAEKTADTSSKEAFGYLKDQEVQHEEWLRSLYDRLVLQVASSSANLEWETLAEIEFIREAELRKKGKSPELFSQAGGKFKLALSDMAVFSAGALMEQASIDFYTKAAASTQNEEAKKIYTILVEWEGDHLNQLNEIHENLTELWIQEQDFSSSPKL
ncbi:Rubrerythrin [Syntrophobotulus glycolicus DSM 8271]|uniref:Rubrerythrin n=1 Tax=Syntrophobotulus glycolicus (strain DSM 8271 / FlGlyR) TaxID=645991 RepID=F0SUV2_SYNGF|nr:ferritin family protein [Syntrophobotulus glycolicus]ADY56668.1 Rubrerythrin [Syntrophobotulus glycolicus DSM 8271]